MVTFGLLTYIAEAGVNKYQQRLWRLSCSCGNEFIALASRVRRGKTKSCGHLRKETRNRKHGARRTRLYTTWCNVKSRCNNPQHPAYKNYGGRGIQLYPPWEQDFVKFAEAVGEAPTPTATLDRIDNSRGYEPGNVRWVERHVQTRNTRQNRWVTIGGTVRCLHDWCKEFKIAPGSVYRRMSRGEGIVSAITRQKARRFQ